MYVIIIAVGIQYGGKEPAPCYEFVAEKEEQLLVCFHPHQEYLEGPLGGPLHVDG